MSKTNKPTREEKIMSFFDANCGQGTLEEISKRTGYPEASISCGLRVLRKQGIKIEKEWCDGVYIYYTENTAPLKLGCTFEDVIKEMENAKNALENLLKIYESYKVKKQK